MSVGVRAYRAVADAATCASVGMPIMEVVDRIRPDVRAFVWAGTLVLRRVENVFQFPWTWGDEG